LNARFGLDHGLTLSTNYRYTGLTRSDDLTQRANVDPQHIFDAALTVPLNANGELTLGVYDVFDESDAAIDSVGDTNIFSSDHPNPGQTFFVRLSWTY